MRLLIADDHDVTRQAVRTLLEARGDLHVVAEASTGREALAMALKSRPDIAIVDWRLPELSGLDVTVALKKELPTIEVLIYTTRNGPEIMLEALRAGAKGLVLKAETERHLLAAIDALSVHRPYFPGTITDALPDPNPGIKPKQI